MALSAHAASCRIIYSNPAGIYVVHMLINTYKADRIAKLFPIYQYAHAPPLGPKGKSSEFSILSYPFHHGAITGVDVCTRKPLGETEFDCIAYAVIEA